MLSLLVVLLSLPPPTVPTAVVGLAFLVAVGTVGGGNDSNTTNNDNTQNGVGDANNPGTSPEIDENDPYAREELLERTSVERKEKIRKITLMLRRNPGLQPRTYAELQTNLGEYTVSELEEIYENLIFDIQARGWCPCW